jgi:hypothetical protein
MEGEDPTALAGADGTSIRCWTVPDRRLRRQQQCQRIRRLGARVLFELIDELDRHHHLGDELDPWLGRYAALDPTGLRALGADGFPRRPALRVIRGGRQ